MLPHAKKSFGQNFLNDPSVVKKIIAAAGIAPGDAVLEIGPGTGVLTQALVDAGARVTAIEADGDLIAPLKKRFGEKIVLVHADALTLLASTPPFPPSGRGGIARILPLSKGELVPPSADGGIGGVLQGRAFKIVANLPYNITSDFFQAVFKAPHRPSRMVVMVQREVVDRIVAKPPDMSLLTVVCQLYAECKKVLNVPAGAFRPIPKVDSAVVRLDLYVPPLGKGGLGGVPSTLNDTERIISIAKAGFSSKRKQLHNNLSAAGYGDADKIKATLTQLGYREDARAENVHTKDWIGLSLLL